MTEQTKFLEVLDRFAKIGQSIGLAGDLLAEGAAVRNGVAQFRTLIPLVGAVNAGKTSLVNAYLQRQHGCGLPTDVVPLTALATEILPAPAEAVERVDLIGEGDSVLREVGLEEFGQIQKQLKTGELEAQYAKAHLQHANLPDGNRKVLVDMPGLDSGLRTHNAAIQRYLPRGSHFLMVVDAEHGTLRQSEIAQLQEFLAQEVDFTVLVNKIDKMQKADADKVVDHIHEQVHDAFGKPAPVHTVSAARHDVAALGNALAAVDFDRALRGFWRARIVHLLDDAVESLHACHSALGISTLDSERAIEHLESKAAGLKEQLRQDKRDIKCRYSPEAVDRIVHVVRDSISEAAPSLAVAYKKSSDVGDRALNEIVRHALNLVVTESQDETMRQIAGRYRTDTYEIKADNHLLTSNLIANRGSFTGTARRIVKVVGRANRRFHVIVELLDELLGVIERSQVHKECERLAQRIRDIHGPAIASRLRPRVQSVYEDFCGQILSDLGCQIEANIGRLRTDIQKSRTLMRTKKECLQARKQALERAISHITSLRSSLAKRR